MSFMWIETQYHHHEQGAYECVSCGHRVRDIPMENPASFACPECRGVMRRGTSIGGAEAGQHSPSAKGLRLCALRAQPAGTGTIRRWLGLLTHNPPP